MTTLNAENKFKIAHQICHVDSERKKLDDAFSRNRQMSNINIDYILFENPNVKIPSKM
jgi:hypothetical protein